MNLKNQVISLELAKRLKELNCKQESLWMWVKYEFWKEPKLWLSDMNSKLKTTCLSGKREYGYSAFTCAELGEMLPSDIDGYNLYISKGRNSWWVEYDDMTNERCLRSLSANTEANARAKMFVYLKEKGLERR